MNARKICDVPWEELKIGDHVISMTGKRGYIAGLYPVGTCNPISNTPIHFADDFGNQILFLWISNPSTWSLAGHNFLEVSYLGSPA